MADKLRVAFVTHLPNLSGANQSLLDLLAGLQENQTVEPFVLLGRTGVLEEKLKELNVKYKVIRYGNLIQGDNSKWRTFSKNVLNQFAKFQIAKWLKEESIDLVHNNSYLVGIGMEAAKLAKIPYICHLRDFVWEDHGIKLENEARQEELLNQADAVIAVSHAVEKKYAPLSERIRVIYDALDKEKYRISPDERAPLFSNEEVNLYIAGRIVPGKGQLDAVKAVELLNKRQERQFNLEIIGTATNQEYFDFIASYIEEKKLADFVKLKEYSSDLRSLRLKSDIGLVCSHNEAMGRVTLENMLAGCLTIGANSGGTSELIQSDRYGYLYDPSNPCNLADKIEEAIADPEEASRRRDAAYQFVDESFNRQNYVKEIVALYEEAIERTKK
ncbi:glycosyltransferase family 4 protein [Streptococcus loxodontisalivarius]|uniref:Glycosyltransferase involved in cell wall biosynthesis n=1 Tax=Streptococcus loxodontisalivarius TaxID=1349415 RepID=A0ABS2PQF5_9STRE|nr:glycosyltransferase family 4 protein [Streptococcus loxodontisalivarius]MBM7641760.1 glycosyltransferase involved in cell wall biosynthesis [Streptococcus loxodontisalivarius]